MWPPGPPRSCPPSPRLQGWEESGGVHTRGPPGAGRAHFLGCWCHQETRARGSTGLAWSGLGHSACSERTT